MRERDSAVHHRTHDKGGTPSAHHSSSPRARGHILAARPLVLHRCAVGPARLTSGAPDNGTRRARCETVEQGRSETHHLRPAHRPHRQASRGKSREASACYRSTATSTATGTSSTTPRHHLRSDPRLCILNGTHRDIQRDKRFDSRTRRGPRTRHPAPPIRPGAHVGTTPPKKHLPINGSSTRTTQAMRVSLHP